MVDSSPQRNINSSFNLSGLTKFLPLSDDVVSTRGQMLPALIQSRSTASLRDLRAQFSKRRRSSVTAPTDNDEQSDTDRNTNGSRERPGGLQKRSTTGAEVLMTPEVRSQRLIGKNNPRYNWQNYYKKESELKAMKKPIREYYKRNNFLISQYLYIDRLLDSSLPHNLLQEYHHPTSPCMDIPKTIDEEPATPSGEEGSFFQPSDAPIAQANHTAKVKRTPKALYKIPDVDESTPLLDDGDEGGVKASDIEAVEDEGEESGSPIVTVAIYVNLAANALLLVGKIVVIVLTSSLSVLASLVDAALDFLSTAIIWTTTKLISQQDQYSYPVGRRRLEPIGVLVFSVVMITSFAQVALECLNRLNSGDHSIVQLTVPAIAIMASTVLIKLGCYFWCRFIKNSSVQALAQDAMTDVVFNTFSIIFPLVGYYARIWWLDALGGLLLSLYVIINWARTSAAHIRNLTGAAASADERNVLLYLTMRFAKTIKQIQGLQAYHAGDKLNVEVDIVLDEGMTLRDSHDLGESLQYVLESVPYVDRAFVHQDYAGWNLPSHMQQQQQD